MKRFYCTICKRVKRVQQYPSHITPRTREILESIPPQDRIGECNFHQLISNQVSKHAAKLYLMSDK